jgi:hypothetical protein
MSGASALAAAKRRRAVPTEPVRPTPVSQKTQEQRNQNQIIQNQAPVQVQNPSPNPLHLLLQHEQKLKDLEGSFNQLKLSENKSNTLTPDNLIYFKTQHDLMHQELNELKKIIIKVQTFSMETNLDVLKIKKILKINESIEPNEPIVTTENIA